MKTKKKYTTLCPEHELILLCHRYDQSPDVTERVIAICNGKLDWDYILGEANRQCTGGLLYRTLSKVCPSAIPEQILNVFKVHYASNISHNLQLTSELYRIVSLFNAHDVKIILYKGPIQASEIYGNLALRQICDLDLIIHKEDILRAYDLLVSNGYTLHRGLTKESLLSRVNSNTAYDCAFQNPDKMVNIEIHWQAMMSHSEFGVNGDYLWKHAVPMRLCGHEIFGFNKIIKMLMLCLHNEKHNWYYLKFLVDFAWMLEKFTEDELNTLMVESQNVGRDYDLLKGLFLSQCLFRTNLPGSIREKIDGMPQLKMESAVIHYQLFKDGFCLPVFSEWLTLVRDKAYCGHVLNSTRGKIRYWVDYLKVILTPHYEDRKLFPTPLSNNLQVLYIILRVMRFAKYWMVNGFFSAWSKKSNTTNEIPF